ncbi:uncharacterized protein LACBIDRAFT_303789 [Laccaria bicolor S238N-H82]|uniref:Predicted protein n=1 Tax=Laccaria bicolor (strain S238N-H82 / ATCC MYA-4686) TaxID=486041 RepID=B0DKB5_LACBS|nr:uncharacterized protein LACBIDRAFT_303789 [Laccaria bicolor S238N-H82]EDR05039.1 predicted protein [Laccaria bicolor S238N-H82]|eukprot:XP_001884429.1 predicted protein [Laccaria bicolor S238N-H82]
MVWDETVRVVNGFFDIVWGDQEIVVVDHCVSDITMPVRPMGFTRERLKGVPV